MDATDHWSQMRHKSQADIAGITGNRLQSLDNLRQMTMAFHTIGVEIIGRLRKQGANSRLSSRAGNTRLAVSDQRRFIDKRLALAEQWRIPKLN